ncbi:iron complex transport system ATP-binding protein [Roseivirga ehrenbergii]|nr:ABC transporter ATP-binding protein [Roseivirga ehrenbergii]TCL10587.1 iron complex transport system ATP-binding protein [Roseivirga ehrenbergii]
MMKETRTILSTTNLTVGYKDKKGIKPVLSNLNLSLEKGKLTCLLGTNGAGKSTLMRTIGGIQKPLKGEVFMQGKPIRSIDAKSLSKQLSLVLTDRIAPGNLTVYALVSLGRFPYTSWLGTLSQKDKDIIFMAMEATGILEFANKHIGELSDGERQKVMIARTLAQDTEVIFLDEPTAHLDLPNRMEIFHLLRALAVESDKAILLTTHELDMALANADHLWLINQNQTIDSGLPEDLVLNGLLEEAFQRDQLQFDYELGTFKRTSNQSKTKVRLEGDVILKRWTRSALERAGYEVTPDTSDLEIKISGSLKAPLWHLNHNDTTYKTIQELLIQLNNQ